MIRNSDARDPPKCERVGDKIMLSFNRLGRDRRQNRLPLLPIARSEESRLLHTNSG
jgi:hypothetical protein